MPGLTPNQDYPYPLDSELIDVAGDIENLAMSLDTDISVALATVANKVDRTGDTMTGMLSLPGTNPVSLNHAARKGYVDEMDETRVAVTGDSMSGNLDLGTNKVTGLGPPTGANDAARKAYVDEQFGNAVRLDVSSTQAMIGPLRSPRFVLTDLTPDNPEEVPSKQYVDGRIDESFAHTDRVIGAYLSGQNSNTDILIQGSIGMVALDGMASAIIPFPVLYIYPPVVMITAGAADQTIFLGLNVTGTSQGQFIMYGKHISTGNAAYGATVLFEWLAVGYKAEG